MDAGQIDYCRLAQAVWVNSKPRQRSFHYTRSVHTHTAACTHLGQRLGLACEVLVDPLCVAAGGGRREVRRRNARERRVGPVHADKRAHLVLDQSEQRRDNHADTAREHGRKLVAQAFALARRKQHEDVVAVERCLNVDTCVRRAERELGYAQTHNNRIASDS
eukprot:6211924-Pleurochrysis_carterae.AAC.2